MSSSAICELSPEALARIDREIAEYPPGQKQSAVMAALVIAQDEKGWLPKETIAAVAGYLGMAPIAAYEVASFYNMYDLHPVGKYKLTVCTNLPCALSGGVHAADAGALASEVLGVALPPIDERTIALAFHSGKLGRDVIERH